MSPLNDYNAAFQYPEYIPYGNPDPSKEKQPKQKF